MSIMVSMPYEVVSFAMYMNVLLPYISMQSAHGVAVQKGTFKTLHRIFSASRLQQIDAIGPQVRKRLATILALRRAQ